MKLISIIITLLVFCKSAAFAQDYPTITGEIISQFQTDRIISSDKENIAKNNGFIFIEPKINFNFNDKLKLQTNWRLQQDSTINTRNHNYPERYRSFFGGNYGKKESDRGFNFDDSNLIIEEIKLNYKYDDLEIYAGKFDPKFGIAHNKSYKSGIYTWQVTEDYNLREKLGLGISAILENATISFNSFINDTSPLSNSALKDRGAADNSRNISGNKGAFSSYAFSFKGDNFFNVEGLGYNFGYRNLGVKKIHNFKRESGYTAAIYYKKYLNYKLKVTPFVEYVDINNFGGFKDYKAKYATLSLNAEYSNWNTGVSYIRRDLSAFGHNKKTIDKFLQIFVGYKINRNFQIDLTHGRIEESGINGVLFGASLNYLYEF